MMMILVDLGLDLSGDAAAVDDGVLSYCGETIALRRILLGYE